MRCRSALVVLLVLGGNLAHADEPESIDARITARTAILAQRHYDTGEYYRAIGNFDISWDPLRWLNVKYTLGADYSSDQRIEGLPPQSAGDALTAADQLGVVAFDSGAHWAVRTGPGREAAGPLTFD